MDDLADAAGVDRDVLNAYLNGTTVPLQTQSDLNGLDAIEDVLHDITRKETAGVHVDYIDAEVFREHHLADIKVTARHPALRVILHAASDEQPYVSSAVYAVPGMSALDAIRAEGARADNVARVVLSKKRPEGVT
jgi:hypothetical protein